MKDAECRELLRLIQELFDAEIGMPPGRANLGRTNNVAPADQSLPTRCDERTHLESRFEVLIECLQRLCAMGNQIDELRSQGQEEKCRALISARDELQTVVMHAYAEVGLGFVRERKE